MFVLHQLKHSPDTYLDSIERPADIKTLEAVSKSFDILVIESLRLNAELTDRQKFLGVRYEVSSVPVREL